MVAGGAAFALVVVLAASAAAAKTTARHAIATPATLPLRTAILDHLFEGQQQESAFSMAQAAGATYVRLSAPWRSIAPATPGADFVAADPTSPGYSWSGLDSVMVDAAAAGITPILDIVAPPQWGYAQQPKGVNAGTPDVAALGDFATALATHYNGLTPGIPAEHVCQVWTSPI